MKYIHTILLTPSKQQGLAIGHDGRTGKSFRIWLMSPRAVDVAMRRLRSIAGEFNASPKKIRRERLQQIDGLRGKPDVRCSHQWSMR